MAGAPSPTRAQRRSADRRITQAGLACAGLFLVASIGSVWLPDSLRHGLWLPLHLALAGAATQAIAAAMPYFTAALLAAVPAPAGLRALALVLPGLGALAIAIGVPGGLSPLATAGGAAYVAGILALAGAAFAPLLDTARPRHRWVLAAYAVALGDVAAGAALATLFVGGFAPVARAWRALLPAHAWLNLLGFVSLVIAGTLIHLFPTVIGARLRYGWQAPLLVVGLGLGPPAVALGYVVRSDAITRTGAVVAAVGTLGLAALALSAWRVRGRWAGDLPWRALVIGQLVGGIAWFAVATLLAAGRTLAFGADPAGWSADWLIAPLGVGWMAQSLLGAWAHLLPAIGSGSPERHAHQRRLLGRARGAQLGLVNAGTALLAVALPDRLGLWLVAGAALASAGILLGLGALLLAARLRDPRAASSA